MRVHQVACSLLVGGYISAASMSDIDLLEPLTTSPPEPRHGADTHRAAGSTSRIPVTQLGGPVRTGAHARSIPFPSIPLSDSRRESSQNRRFQRSPPRRFRWVNHYAIGPQTGRWVNHPNEDPWELVDLGPNFANYVPWHPETHCFGGPEQWRMNPHYPWGEINEVQTPRAPQFPPDLYIRDLESIRRSETRRGEPAQGNLYTTAAPYPTTAPPTRHWYDLLTTNPPIEDARPDLNTYPRRSSDQSEGVDESAGVSQDTDNIELSPGAVVPLGIDSKTADTLCIMCLRKVPLEGNLALACNQHVVHSCMKRLHDIAKTQNKSLRCPLCK